MASIRPRIELVAGGFEALTDVLVEEYADDIEPLLHQMGREMVEECVRICQTELPTGEHKPFQTHLDESFTYVVDLGPGPGRTPWDVYLTIKPGVSAGKIWALNNGSSGGSRSYTIWPRHAPRALEFKGPGTDLSEASADGRYEGRVLRPYANRTATSGPKQGTFFLERARDIVMERYGFS